MKFSSVIFIGLFLCCFSILIVNNNALAESEIILQIDDPVNDDYGPGTYQYPSNEVFAGKGLFDIRSFSILDTGGKYQLNFVFTNLLDPWNSKYGFSLPLIELYFGRKEEGSDDLFNDGANVRLDPHYPWNRMLKISGWWVRVYKPEDKLLKEENFWDVENHPADIKDPDISVNGNTLSILLEKEVIGELEDSYVYILVGSYDPFGPDHFRDIKSERSPWYFSSISDDNLEYAPRVIDIILPEGMEQKSVLCDFKEGYPTLVPVSINSVKNRAVVYLPSILLIFIFILLALFVMNKKTPISNNK